MNQTTENGRVLQALESLRLRLLDLTGRNRLINFKHTKKGSLRVIDELPDQLVETLLTETEMRFLPVPEPTREELYEAGYIEIDENTGEEIRIKKDPSAEEWASHLGLETSYEVPTPSSDQTQYKHRDSAIQTLLYPYELEVRLKNLTQTAESAIQEMGANILYLVFGFLEWFDSNNENARIAPLFLVPVRLKKGRLNQNTKTYEYTINYSGEDIIPNLSLREKLRADFAMALPELDENTLPESYFDEINELIKKTQPRWRLRRFTTLTLLNFSKLLMYLDLDPGRWPEGHRITDHPVIKRFLSGYDPEQELVDDEGHDFGFGEEYLIDEVEDIHTKYPLIDDADSSQHSALIDAVSGKNLVIEGPPGTGKSQTITNLIAAALAQGKRVLFVAEKLAALEVVRRRLDAAGLGEFCLELHSHKSQKRKVLEEVKARLEKHGRYRAPRDIDLEIARYEEIKAELKHYVEQVNRPWKKTDKTIHEILIGATRYREDIGVSPDALHPEGYNGDNLDAATQRRLEEQVHALHAVHRSVAAQIDGSEELKRHPWYGVLNPDLQMFDIGRVQSLLEHWQDALRSLEKERPEIADTIKCDQDDIPDSIEGFASLVEDLKEFSSLQGNELIDRLPVLRGSELSDAKEYLRLSEDIQSQYDQLKKYIRQDVLADLSKVRDYITGVKWLEQSVDSNITIDVLADAIEKLEAVSYKLVELERIFREIQAAVGANAAEHLRITESGLLEFQRFAGLVVQLSPSYWKLRDDRFDNDEMDETLPRLKVDIERLRVLRDRLSPMFLLDSLPAARTLKDSKDALDSGGALRWFKSDWRRARKQVLDLASGKSIKFARMYPLLDEVIEFSERREEFKANRRYKEIFGEYLSGIDTDIDSLFSLRSWYKAIRSEYGIGFGPRVAMGDAIMGLQIEVARAIRSLSDQGLENQLIGLLNDLKTVRRVFSSIPELKDNTVLLAGSGGIADEILQSSQQAIASCKPLLDDNTLSISALRQRIESLKKLEDCVEAWRLADCDNKLFEGCLNVSVGVNIDNRSSLSILRNTVTLADFVESSIKNDCVRQAIYSQPEMSTIQTLVNLSERLSLLFRNQTEAYRAFADFAGIDLEQWITDRELECMVSRNAYALANPQSLQSWLDYVRVRAQAVNMGLGGLTGAVEEDTTSIEAIEDAYKAGVYDLLARELLREHPEMARFSGHSHEALREQYRNYDERLKELQCEKIAWNIDRKQIPVGNGSGPVRSYTERRLLEHECGLQRPRTPIRQLLHRAGGALVSLKPCFMMGPLSAAQYLEPARMEFDLVVMDEASQIKPEDALGVIARGAQTVVVGDPKQLPPTSFFDRVMDDGADDEATVAVQQTESILDATMNIFSRRRLRWHYRSQHESLIAFSNLKFYDSDLVLFPSPYKENKNYGVRYTRVRRGCFVNRRNMEEARVISESVREHFRQFPEESLGVVAMSAEQRLQIESAIETLSKEDAAFQEWLDRDSYKQEPLFIKNLENVQGDQRDVIFISMTYGPPEPGGKPFQRFGPITYEAGWRRLNVLFSRSKKRMHVFSSMGSDDITVGTSTKRGVAALKDFLAYCETGILHMAERETGRPPDSDFEVAVMKALGDKGFECVPQVGVAGFFIDVAVVDPGNPGHYLMGIECDGATYHSAKSTRDRDRLRQSILERLGWRIRRIWSTDWFKNPHGELQPIVRELNSLKTEKVEKLKEGTASQMESIDETIESPSSEALNMDSYASKDMGLREKLLNFDKEVIRKMLPEVPAGQRLLRPAMLEAILEYTPCSEVEFLEYIPSYLRRSTHPEEGRFLDDIFNIINASLEEAVS